MYYTLMKYRRGGKEIYPFRLFVKGFRENFVRATVVWLGALCFMPFLLLEMFWCSQAAGVMHLFLYALGTLFLVSAVLLYVFPGIAAFDVPIRRQVLNSMFFAGKSPATVLLLAAFVQVPFYVTYSFMEWLPLWAFCGAVLDLQRWRGSSRICCFPCMHPAWQSRKEQGRTMPSNRFHSAVSGRRRNGY